MLANFIPKKQLTIILPDAIVIICCITSIVRSTIESRLNLDAHHWGLMYGNAADLNNGLIPYKEIFIQYGFLTTFIQSLSLNIFGNTVVSVGIVTGIFYAVNIYFSYCLWQKVLSKSLSALSSLLMFLSHAYIIYPWSNYFSYTFLLTSLLFLISSSRNSKVVQYLLSGVFLALSFLARQSLFIIFPFYPYFSVIYISSKSSSRKEILKNILMFHLGFLSIIATFLIYLIKQDALSDWINQTFTITEYYKSFLSTSNISSTLQKIIFPFNLNAVLLLYSFISFNAFIIFSRILFLAMSQKLVKLDQQSREIRNTLFLISSTTLFGYLQSLHIYEIFRLQSSSSLGFGLLVFSLMVVSGRLKKWEKLGMVLPLSCLFVHLALTSNIYIPKQYFITHQLKQPDNIRVLRGKLYDQQSSTYYESLTKTMNDYNCQLEYIINFSRDSYLPYLSKHFKKVQRSPFYDQGLSGIIFKDEQAKISSLLTEEKALVITPDINLIPGNYHIVLEIKSPDVIRWIDRVHYVAVPQIVSPICMVDN